MNWKERRELPVGIQDFEKLRTENCVYVDKTEYIYRLTRIGKPYFLGRPRRFGKSLLISTLKAYFLGKKELFEGLALAELEKDWVEYPVFHFDFTLGKYDSMLSFESALDTNLRRIEEQWGRNVLETTAEARFSGLIRRVYTQTGKRVVVLIDEYDKPLISTMEDATLNKAIRENLKGFYGLLKGSDQYLRFVMLTGVTKFSKVSVFSDLNQLVDISLMEEYAGICGISESELVNNFEPEIQALAEKRNMTRETALAELQKRYNGYHFSENSEGVYNPFSLLNTFFSLTLRYYWFESGTPTFLINLIKQVDFDIRKFAGDIRINARSIADYRTDNTDPVPILYQTGYLTIKGYDQQLDEYILGLPNEEVKYAFLAELLPVYINKQGKQRDFSAGEFIRELRSGEVDAFMERIRALFGYMPYELNDKSERHYQSVFFLIFTMMGQFIQTEVRSARGRADAVVILPDTVYVFEFKITGNGTAEEALQQIDDKGYLIPYSVGQRKTVKIGAEFDPAERTLKRWLIKFD
ncbi:MAG: ATP-binding protein [Prevotellaceae bacterium]|jgi:hypothetical protein|nr:ATP-binding protein [Prevotellaceae bacterium]